MRSIFRNKVVQGRFTPNPLQVKLITQTPIQSSFNKQHINTPSQLQYIYQTPRNKQLGRPMSQKLFTSTTNINLQSIIALRDEIEPQDTLTQQQQTNTMFTKTAQKNQGFKSQFTYGQHGQPKVSKQEANAKQLDYLRKMKPEMFESDQQQIFRLQKQAITYQLIHQNDTQVELLQQRIKEQVNQRELEMNQRGSIDYKKLNIMPGCATTRVQIPSYVQLLYQYYTSPEIVLKRNSK
uniref:Uncharacterized protein n=1 Tax=Spironucleus salmonicida TaxID=348837 RepID=V6LRH7_9EUKA|eukprot:EST46301.1 Hypothetical protein SS50377_13687 [Spironucleus salmonicida]